MKNDIEKLMDPDTRDLFWAFVCERQEVWHKRFVLKQKAPWSQDPALQNVFFTNVYRELDTGTKYLFANILDYGDPTDELFEILLYRQFNNVDTYQFLKNAGRGFGDFKEWNHWAELLKVYSKDHTVFTRAHMTTSLSAYGYDNKIDNMCYILHGNWAKINQIYTKLIVEAKDMEEQHKYLKTLDGFGDFLSYEVVTDISYSRIGKFSEDSWANAGPGCRKAIDSLMGSREQMYAYNIEYLDVIRYLRNNQAEGISRLGLKFRKFDNRDLSLRNIEHSLCEFHKYCRYTNEGKARRKYDGQG